MTEKKTRVGIVGYGNTGKYLLTHILNNPKVSSRFALAFVWNRTFSKVEEDKLVPKDAYLQNLDDFASKKPDLIVEVAHPSITKDYGVAFVQYCDYFVGSPTTFADQKVETALRTAANKHGVYIPAGALWGANDIQKLAESGSLQGLTITMKKHPESLKVAPSLLEKLKKAPTDQEVVLFEGSVRDLCPLAPNNVNTMACAALAGLGFDNTKAKLIADSRLKAHLIEIEVLGPESEGSGQFKMHVTRYNPAQIGAVTGNATYGSFLSSLLWTGGKGCGFHFC